MQTTISTKVWLVRLAISAVVTAGVAWAVSFLVADYVVRANTVSASATIEAINNSVQTMVSADAASRSGLQASIDTLNTTLIETNRAVGGLRDDTTFLVVGQKEQSGQIADLAQEIAAIKLAVGEAVRTAVQKFATEVAG